MWEGRKKVCGGRNKCRNVGRSVGRSGKVREGRAKCMEVGDGVWSVRNVYVGCGKCVEGGGKYGKFG